MACLKKNQFSNHCLHNILSNEHRCVYGMEMCKGGHNCNLLILKNEVAKL